MGPHTSVCIISNKSVARSIVPENGVLVILPMRHGSQVPNDYNQVIPKVHQHGVSSCALHQYDLNGSATHMLHYHYQLCIFWHQYYEYVYHHDRDSTEIDHSLRGHDHKRNYSYK